MAVFFPGQKQLFSFPSYKKQAGRRIQAGTRDAAPADIPVGKANFSWLIFMQCRNSPASCYFVLCCAYNSISTESRMLAKSNHYIKYSPLYNDNQQTASQPSSVPPLSCMGCFLSQAAIHNSEREPIVSHGIKQQEGQYWLSAPIRNQLPRACWQTLFF